MKVETRRAFLTSTTAGVAVAAACHGYEDQMKFAVLTAPSGALVYVNSGIIVQTSPDRPDHTLVRTQSGQQEVKEGLNSVVRAFEALPD